MRSIYDECESREQISGTKFKYKNKVKRFEQVQIHSTVYCRVNRLSSSNGNKIATLLEFIYNPVCDIRNIS